MGRKENCMFYQTQQDIFVVFDLKQFVLSWYTENQYFRSELLSLFEK